MSPRQTCQRAYRGAITYTRRLLRQDPLREATYRCLMRLHALDDDRSGALHAYHDCVTALRRELGVEPDPPDLKEAATLLEELG